ncbi:MAG: HAMP domain-containing protein [Proteobacteria bacterium]|nr:HAMP domain-containing protein [Pseudomonadota bacterium]
MFNSIKLKLIIWSLVLFALVFTGLELTLYYKLEGVAIGFVDSHISSEVGMLASLAATEEKHGQLEPELYEITGAASGEYADMLSGRYFQILTHDGEIVTNSPSLYLADAMLPIVIPGAEGVYDIVDGPTGRPIRLFSKAFEFEAGTYIFQAGDTLDDTNLLLSSFRKMILMAYPLVFFVCGLGVFIVTRLALGPLRLFSEKVGEITEEKLDERVDASLMCTEVRPLAESFNVMLGSLENSFDKQKQFLSDASHELRTPTTIIKSYCDITLSRNRTEEEYRAAITKMGSAVNRLSEIINRILVISRLDSKTVQLKLREVDVFGVVQDVVNLLTGAAETKGIDIILSGTEVSVCGDKEGLTEVFTNLVENGVKYNKSGGRVDVSVAKEGENAVVVIRDTGIGITTEDQAKVFDRFYRVDTSREQTVGSGLGLAIVSSIIAAHGGRLELESTEGVGSTFKVYLPEIGSVA